LHRSTLCRYGCVCAWGWGWGCTGGGVIFIACTCALRMQADSGCRSTGGGRVGVGGGVCVHVLYACRRTVGAANFSPHGLMSWRLCNCRRLLVRVQLGSIQRTCMHMYIYIYIYIHIHIVYVGTIVCALMSAMQCSSPFLSRVLLAFFQKLNFFFFY
jgi:hypothetical protein